MKNRKVWRKEEKKKKKKKHTYYTGLKKYDQEINTGDGERNSCAWGKC